MPGLPLFCRTRFNAPTRLARPTSSSIRRCSLPERSSPWATVPASPLPSTFGASPLSSSGSSSCLDSWRMAFSRSTVVTLSSPFGPSSDKAGSKRIMHFVGLLWPLLTSRSAGRPNSAMPASPFQASGETSPGKNDDLPRTIAGSTPLPPWSQELRGQWSARPGPQRLVSGSCSSTHGFVSRFVQRTPHDERLALPFGPCDQVPGGLSPPRHRPCRAHYQKGGPDLAAGPSPELHSSPRT